MTYSINTESAYDWRYDDWGVPINVNVSKVMKFVNQTVSVGAAVRYWAESTEIGPEGWGARFSLTFLFPR